MSRRFSYSTKLVGRFHRQRTQQRNIGLFDPGILGGTLSISNTLSTNLITACNISTWTISTQNAYATTLSTAFLDVKSGNVSSMLFYDPASSSTGTFRYSTLGMTVLAPTSFLYFNNFIVAGAYVWPGQVIKN